jgi:hypothetical protein
MEKIMKFSKIIQVAAFGATIALCASGTAALADTIDVSYLAPGVQTAASPNVETFNNSFNGTTTFNGSGITGTYTGDYTIASHDIFGGAGGTGNYITATNGSSYTLTLTSSDPSFVGVNYFGYWLSALDAGNQVQLYNGSTLIYTFVPQDLINALGVCSTGGGYCGNPNEGFGNADQLYAYTNFFDTNGTFNKIVFTETCCGGYESDNHAFDMLTTPPVGTPLNPVPEPSSLVLLGTGVLGIAGSLRRKLFAR